MPSKRKASTPKASTAAATNKKSKGRAVEKPDPVVEAASSTVECDFVEDEVEVEETECESSNEESSSAQKVRRATQANDDQECEFSGDSISHAEAMQKWPHRYINHKVCFA